MPHHRNSQINGLIRQATPKQPASPPPQPSHPTIGNGNVIIGSNIVTGGNVTTVYRGRTPVSQLQQNMAPCPTCTTPMSVSANACMECGDDLANRRLLARQRRARWTMAAIGTAGIAAMTIATHYKLPSVGTVGVIATILALFIDRA